MSIFKKKNKVEVNTTPMTTQTNVIEVFIEEGIDNSLFDTVKNLYYDIFKFKVVILTDNDGLEKIINDCTLTSHYLNPSNCTTYLDLNRVIFTVVDSLQNILSYIESYYMIYERGKIEIIDRLYSTCYGLKEDLEYLEEKDNYGSNKYKFLKDKLEAIFTDKENIFINKNTSSKNNLISMYYNDQLSFSSRVVFFISDEEYNNKINRIIIENRLMKNKIEDAVYTYKDGDRKFYNISIRTLSIIYNSIDDNSILASILNQYEKLKELVFFYNTKYININDSNLYDSIDELL